MLVLHIYSGTLLLGKKSVTILLVNRMHDVQIKVRHKQYNVVGKYRSILRVCGCVLDV